MIQKLAKKACIKESETKFQQQSDGVLIPYNSDFKSWNLFANFTHGTGDNQCIGSKIHWRGLKIHWEYVMYGDSVRGWFDTPVTFWFMLVETKKYDINGVVLDDVRDDTTNSVLRWFPNNETKILYKKKKIFNAVKDGDRPVFTGSIWLKRNQSIQFKDFPNTKQLNKKNYYFVVYAADRAVSTHPTFASGQFYYSWKNYFKDA